MYFYKLDIECVSLNKSKSVSVRVRLVIFIAHLLEHLHPYIDFFIQSDINKITN